MNTLQSLNLNENDFKLIIDGLDCLPEKGFAGEMMGDLLMGMIAKDDPLAQEKMKQEREKSRRDREMKKAAIVDDIKILQGKLLMLKRYLMEQGALNETTNILNNFR